METKELATYEVWYTKPNGEQQMAWQGLTQAQAWRKAVELTALGYEACAVYTGP